MHGKVELPRLKEEPPLLLNLYRNKDARSNNFVQNILRYNMMFSFTSMAGKVDATVNNGGGPYVFRIHGQNYHIMGNLFPIDSLTPKFSQLYIYDTENEVANRLQAVRYMFIIISMPYFNIVYMKFKDSRVSFYFICSSENSDSTTQNNMLDREIATDLKNLLDVENELVKSYRMVRDLYQANGFGNVHLRLIGLGGELQMEGCITFLLHRKLQLLLLVTLTINLIKETF